MSPAGTPGHRPAVRTLGPADLAATAALHRRVFPAYSSTRLGAGFCRRLLGAYAARGDAVVLVAGDDPGPVEGYLVGAPPAVQRAVNDALAGRAALAGLGQLVRSPRRALAAAPQAAARGRAAVRALSRRFRRSGGGPVPAGPAPVTAPTPADVRVVLIGVDADARGRGVADALLAELVHRAPGHGWHTADLVVAAGNTAAHRAYERNGWHRVPVDADGAGDGSVRYRLDLDAGSPDPTRT